MAKLPEAGVRFVAPGAAAFNAAVGAANKAVSGFCGSAGGASKCISNLGQIAIGALREIGALAVRGFVAAGREALRFAESLLQAAFKESELERTTKSLYAGLVEVTRISLTPLANQITDLVKRAGPGFLGVAQAALTHLGGLGGRALTWGHNLITQFANGIINGAVAVINALADIAQQIAYWLSPGSPPRLLPDIDKWGAGAMQAYLQGFTLADFGVFQEIAGTVEGYLRSLSQGKDTGLIPSILGSRDAIAKAIAQVRASGQVTQQTLNGVFAALGPASQAMRDYVAATLELERVNTVVRELEAQFKSLSDAQQALLDEGTISQLELVAKDPGATAREKEIARLEIERLKTGGKLNGAKTEQTAAQSAFDMAKARVQIETDTNNLLKAQETLLESLIEKVKDLVDKLAKGAGGGGLVKPMLPEFDLLEKLIDRFREPLGRLQAAWIALWVKIVIAMQPAINAWNNIVVPAWLALVKAFEDTIPKIQTLIAQMVAYALLALSIVLPIVFRILAAALTILKDIWEDNHELILAATKWSFEAVVKIMVGAAVAISIALLALLLLVQMTFAAINLAVNNTSSIWAGAMAAMAGVIVPVVIAINTLFGSAKGLWDWLQAHAFVFRISLPELPPWAIPGSPTPFEIGLRGIANALKDVNRIVAPPASAVQIAGMRGGDTYTNSTTLNYQPSYTTPARGPAQDYAVIQTFFRGARG